MLKSFPIAMITLIAGLAGSLAQDAPVPPAASGSATVTAPAKVVQPPVVQPTPSVPAADSMNTNIVDAPLKGANSFTESQVRNRLVRMALVKSPL